MKIYTCDWQRNIIDEVPSIEAGRELIKQYEEEDKENGLYDEDAYTLAWVTLEEGTGLPLFHAYIED